MEKRYNLIFPLLFTLFSLNAQETNEFRKQNSFFLEGGGKGYVSVNYDYRFSSKHAISTGITMLDYTWVDLDKVDSTADFTLPTPGIMYYFLPGKNGHYFELGAGLSVLPYWGVDYGDYDTPFSLHGVIGYRYQKPNKIFVRAGLCPFYRIKWMVLPLPGVSIGYSW